MASFPVAVNRRCRAEVRFNGLGSKREFLFRHFPISTRLDSSLASTLRCTQEMARTADVVNKKEKCDEPASPNSAVSFADPFPASVFAKQVIPSHPDSSSNASVRRAILGGD
jgi:hypothetical protein